MGSNQPALPALRLCGLSGSLRARSTNTALLQAFARNAPEGLTLDLEAPLATLPLFNPDLEADTPKSVLDFAARIADCDGLLIASPEYAHGMTGALKNGLDWLVSRSEIPHKAVMLVHASARSDTSRDHLREVLRTMSCRLYAGTEFQIHLIGKQPREIDEILASGDLRSGIEAALLRFADFIRQRD